MGFEQGISVDCVFDNWPVRMFLVESSLAADGVVMVLVYSK